MTTPAPELLGTWVDEPSPAISGAELSLRALELVTHWKRCGLTADWLAGFCAYDFEPAARTAANNVLSTAINELIENAAKFCADKTEPLVVAAHHHGDVIRIETRNRVDLRQAERLRRALADLTASDLDAVFAQRIEHQAAPGASGVGLLILVKDYHAKVGAKLVVLPSGQLDAHIAVTLEAEEVSGR
jgi:hypothetical protein